MGGGECPSRTLIFFLIWLCFPCVAWQSRLAAASGRCGQAKALKQRNINMTGSLVVKKWARYPEVAGSIPTFQLSINFQIHVLIIFNITNYK